MTGLAILDAILAGQRRPEILAEWLPPTRICHPYPWVRIAL